jgi:ATP-dependent DNA ligase
MEFRVSGLKARANSRVDPGWLDAPRRPAAHHRRGMKDRIKDSRAHETTRLIAAAVAQSSQQKLRVPATQGGVPAYLHFLPWPQKDQSWGHFFGRMGLRRQRHSTLRISVPIKTVMVLLCERTRPGLGIIEPCLPSPAKAPPSGPGWLHEIKHDGFRILARRGPAGVRLITRNGNDFTHRFPFVVTAVGTTRTGLPSLN